MISRWFTNTYFNQSNHIHIPPLCIPLPVPLRSEICRKWILWRFAKRHTKNRKRSRNAMNKTIEAQVITFTRCRLRYIHVSVERVVCHVVFIIGLCWWNKSSEYRIICRVFIFIFMFRWSRTRLKYMYNKKKNTRYRYTHRPGKRMCVVFCYWWGWVCVYLCTMRICHVICALCHYIPFRIACARSEWVASI